MTTPKPGRIDIGQDLLEAVNARAEELDVPTSAYIRAVFAEGLRSGRLDPIAIAGLERNPVKRRARATARQWKPTTPGGPGMGPATWESGEWELIRQGLGGRNPKQDDGWYLIGPNMTEPKFVGLTRKAAIREADDYITIDESKSGARELSTLLDQLGEDDA